MSVFVKSVSVEAPPETVFGFHEREDALLLLSPSFPPVRVISKIGGIETGSRVELKIGPFVWIAVHVAYQKNLFFVDDQIVGPFEKWTHRHEFETQDGGTRLTDRIEYRLRGGVGVNRLLGWVVNLGLHQVFAHRHKVTKRCCEKGSP